MMRPRRFISTGSLVATPVSRNTGAIASWITWPMSLVWMFMGCWSWLVEAAVALELLGGADQRARNPRFQRAVAGVRDHAHARAGPGLLQAVGGQRRAD